MSYELADIDPSHARQERLNDLGTNSSQDIQQGRPSSDDEDIHQQVDQFLSENHNNANRYPPISVNTTKDLNEIDYEHQEREEDDEDEAKYDESEGLLGRSPNEEKRAESGSLKDVDDDAGNGYLDMEQMVDRTTPKTDDPSLHSLTFRALLLGVIFCVLGAGASQIFYFKSNAPSFSTYFVLLVTYPMGKFLARVLPNGKRRIWLGRWWEVDLNPGDFSVKEHVLIGVIASSGGASAYASDILSILRLYYHRDLGVLASCTLLITTQSIGFGLAGMLQNILIKPTSMYWPSTLVDVQLFTTLHDKEDVLTRRRMAIFACVSVGCFVYQFFPALLLPTLTSIATLCLISNKSWLLRTLGSGYNGLGILDFSLDWNTVGSSGPLYTPWSAQLNYFAGLALMAWIIAPILLAFNIWDARSFPSATSSGLFTSSFEKFDIHSVLDEDLSLNEEKWLGVRPLLLTPFFAVSYALSFASLTAVLVHVWIWHRKEIKESFSRRTAHTDIHNRLMEAYPAVPSSWYLATLGVNLLAAILLVTQCPLQTPIWALILAVGIATIFLVPVAIITAVSNTTIGLNVLTEFIAGLLMPGKPIANVTFKCYGYMAMDQAIRLLQDQKLGHYMHINPKHMFLAQGIGTTFGCLTNYVALTNVIDTKHDYLDGTQADPTGQWTGRSPNIFFSASVIWGLVAPVRFFAGKYVLLYLGFPIGVAVPIAAYYLHKRYPKWHFDKFSFPVLCHGATLLPQLPTNVITTSFLVGYLANVTLIRIYPSFHRRFVYTVSAALETGSSVNVLFIYCLGVIFSSIGQFGGFWAEMDSEHCIPGS